MPSPFITFSGAGSQNTLIGTYIPPGQVGPFNLVANANGTTTLSFEIDGVIDQNGASTGNGYRLFFSATFPYTEAVLFTVLPQDSICIATSAQVSATAHLRTRPGH